MKTRQEKIDAIYKKIANKTPIFGCKVIMTMDDWMKRDWVIFHWWSDGWDDYWYHPSYEYWVVIYDEKIGGLDWETWYYESVCESDLEILGHPVMINDLIDLCQEKKWMSLFELVTVWKNKRAEIIYQSNECVDFVYDLIS